MRVLYFHQHFTTPSGATGTRSYEMARRLIAAGHRVTMICGSYSTADTGVQGRFSRGMRSGLVDGIEVIELELPYSNHDRFLRRSLTFLRFAFRSVRLALSLPYDVVFATSTPLTAGIPGIAGRWLRNKKFIFEVRDLWPELPRAMGVITNPFVLRLMDWLEWVSYRSAHGCIGLSPGISEGIRRRGKPSEDIAMIPNGSDTELFDSIAGMEDIPGVAAGELCLVFTGAHGIANGLHAVLDAARDLIRRNVTGVKFVFVGDGKIKPELMQRARSEFLSNCIFLDPVPKTELVRLLRKADVGMMILANVPAFYYGTSPNKFFDYLSVGLPVLNNYPGWLASLITEHDCGWVVPPDDPEAFAETVEEIASWRDEARRRGRNARALADTSFSRSILGDEFVRFVERYGSRPTRSRTERRVAVRA